MAYTKEQVLEKLSEEERLILYVINRLDDLAGLINELDTEEKRALVFTSIRFLSTELAELGAAVPSGAPRPLSGWGEDKA